MQSLLCTGYVYMQAKSSDNRLISHPLVISLLMFKLGKYASFHFMTQLVSHILLLLFLSLFALLVYNPNSDICKIRNHIKYYKKHIMCVFSCI